MNCFPIFKKKINNVDGVNLSLIIVRERIDNRETQAQVCTRHRTKAMKKQRKLKRLTTRPLPSPNKINKRPALNTYDRKGQAVDVTRYYTM